MKRKLTSLLLALLLALALTVPALAAEAPLLTTGETNYVFDFTGELSDQQVEELEAQAAEITKRQNCGVYFVLLDDYTDYSEDEEDSAFWTATQLYRAAGLGAGENRDGVLFLLSLEEGDDALIVSGEYAYYAFGGTNQEDLKARFLDDLLDHDWYAGISRYLEGCDEYLTRAADGTTMRESLLGSSGMDHIFDLSGLLSAQQRKELEARAADITKRQDCGVYFVLLDDFKQHRGQSLDGVYRTTYLLYHAARLGVGAQRDGIIILLSMAERDYAMFVYGDYAEYAFDRYGQKHLEEDFFFEDLKNDDWYAGISHYLDGCDEYLTCAADGKPVRESPFLLIVLSVLLSCGVAGYICFRMKASMKSVHQKTEADAYVGAGGLRLTKQYDRYTHTTVTRVSRRKDSDSGGSSGTSSYSGGGGSGRSGKF